MGKHFIVTFPDIGEGVVEGEVIEWLKQEGDILTQDEPVVVVMTDKATVELPAPYPGRLVKQHFQIGQMALKDKPLYEIEIADEEVKEAAPLTMNTPLELLPKKAESLSSLQSTHKESISEKRTTRKVATTPKIRHLAKKLQIDLDEIRGSGREGRILMSDLIPSRLEHTSDSSSEVLHLPDDEDIPLIGIKNLMAKKMAQSKREIPHFSYFETAEVTRLIQLRQNFNKEAHKEGLHVTYMPFIIRALSLCIQSFPALNSSYNSEKGIQHIHKQHNIGIAMSTPRGLIVPVLKEVQSMGMSELIHAYEELIKRAHDIKLQASDMKDATITVSNYGTAGHGLWATPIINFPQVAILAIAKIQQQQQIKNGNIVIIDGMNLSWSFDHRVIDGDLAVHISDLFCRLLQNPASLLS